MKIVKDIMKLMESFAPTLLKEDFDNVGLMVGDKTKEVKKVLIALDCTLEVIEEAKVKEVDLILTHHPLIFRRPSAVTTDTLQGRKIIELIKNDIALYSSHTNLDSVDEGLNHTIAQLLGFNESSILVKNPKDTSAGLGRICNLNQVTDLEAIITLLKKSLKVDKMRIVKGIVPIDKIAIINGSGQDFIEKSIKAGAQCIITGDTTYHYALDYKEMGITIIDIGHFTSEWIVFKETMKKIIKDSSDAELKAVEFIFSDKVKDPYEFY